MMQLFGICQTTSLLMLVTEHMTGGTLGSVLAFPEFRWQQRWGAGPCRPPSYASRAPGSIACQAYMSCRSVCGVVAGGDPS